MIKNIQEEILKLKKEKNAVILAHSYQAKEIVEIADETGDSYALSTAAAKYDCDSFIMCGVHFMAETVKMLSPDKRVFLANSEAGCPMAEQMDPFIISQLKEKEPDRTVVAYINTTAALKTVCDVCVTSATAVKIVDRIKNNKILFIPDCNLGSYVQKQLPDKDIKLLQGGCPVHASVTLQDLKSVKEKHPEALNHPFYGEWVSGYVADAYYEENQVLIDLMDRLSDGYSEKQLQHLEEIFMACSRYEMAFWDMAWEMRR